MATLVFTAIGATLGGPMGGMLGGFIGREVDATLFGGPTRKGPRLDDLRITTSSYGSAIPRQFGTIRTAGTVIWATEMTEHSATQGGGKGSPSVTTYSYTISFAVALSSRPIIGVGRIWADGNLLRGAEGDLKAGGQLRIYSGHGDHAPDPLIAAAEGAYAPAFRGTAYAVFEDLDLTPFGNRIPALSFEVIADETPLTLATMLAESGAAIDTDRALPGLAGFSHDGDTLGDMVATLHPVYPVALDAGGGRLRIGDADAVPANPPLLPEAAATADDTAFGQIDGTRHQRRTSEASPPLTLRYFDKDRDYLAGVQRADGRAMPGREIGIEFPGALSAADARLLANRAASRLHWRKDSLAWRVAQLDPALGPGSVVRVPGHGGHWRIAGWEWRDQGIELELQRLPHGPPRAQAADPGRPQLPCDLPNGPTLLAAFELPWDGSGDGTLARPFAAVSSAAPGWRGAQLFAEQQGMLLPVGQADRRTVIGETMAPLPPSRTHLLERTASLTVRLAAADFALVSASPEMLAQGANRALIGNELIQFARATPLGNGQWRIAGLLRGRGGTEAAAQAGHTSASRFVLIDHRLTPLDPALIGDNPAIRLAALGLADNEPGSTPLANRGLALRPLAPVHPVARRLGDGALHLAWTRRARGAWNWPDGVETPLNEETEAYAVGLGPADAPAMRWETTQPSLTLAAQTMLQLAQAHAGQPLWVRQIGRFAPSAPLLLTTLA